MLDRLLVEGGQRVSDEGEAEEAACAVGDWVARVPAVVPQPHELPQGHVRVDGLGRRRHQIFRRLTGEGMLQGGSLRLGAPGLVDEERQDDEEQLAGDHAVEAEDGRDTGAHRDRDLRGA